MTFSKLLIANRGEIAVRVIRTARRLGYETVAVYSDADRDALHVQEADEAVWIGAAAASASYLNGEALLNAAKRSGAQAIHPGYGFLSENAGFARDCEKAGLIFVGPPAAAIELMGSKRRSKIAMQAAGVPTVPGYEGEDQSDARFSDEAGRIGYPVMIKASAGGGGRGMRRVDAAADLLEGLQRARSEALNAFGSQELILERAILAPRHIEIQVFADSQGQVIHLGERDCSIQRRHQKVVEEAPSPFVDEALRQALGDAAVKAAAACGYVGAGTVEFLVDGQGRFYFLEMNTRLQVEHPVTECITGQDLVAWQLAVAGGAPLPLAQADIHLHGHAIEVRLYAEDPAHDYQPQTGKLVAWRPYAGEGIRIDSGVAGGSIVSPHYDPMLAKLIGWGPDRETARRRLRRTLRESMISGLSCNQAFLAEILDHPAFIAGAATTDFLTVDFAQAETLKAPRPAPLLLALSAVLRYRQRGTGWSNSLAMPVSLDLVHNEQPVTVTVVPMDTKVSMDTKVPTGEKVPTDGKTTGLGSYRVRWTEKADDQSATPAEQDLTLGLVADTGCELQWVCNGLRQRCQYLQQDHSVYLQGLGRGLQITDVTGAAPAAKVGDSDGQLRASMDGTVIALTAQVGMTVERGQVMVVLEAMKMEHPLHADRNGMVAAVQVAVGTQVRQRQLLVSIEPASIEPDLPHRTDKETPSHD